MILCFLFIEATSHGEIEKKVDNLLKQMSVVSGQLQQLSDTVAKFVKCKFCQKKFYKSLDDNDVSREDLATGRKKAEEYRATQATPPASTPTPTPTPTPVASSTPLAKKNENVISIQKSTEKKLTIPMSLYWLAPQAGEYVSPKRKLILFPGAAPNSLSLNCLN